MIITKIKKNMLRERAKKLPAVTDEMWREVNEDFRIIAEEFVSVQDFSPKTKKQYRSALRQFGYYIYSSMNNKPLYKITKRDFLRYRSFLEDHGLSSSSKKFKQNSVSSLCNYIENVVADEDENYTRFRNFTRGLPPIPKNKVYEKIKVTKEEYDLLMEMLAEDENYLGMAWLATAFRVGARKSEIIQFKTEILDYSIPENQSYVLSHTIRGKGKSTDGKPLQYMIPLDVLPYLKKWVEVRGYDHEYIFTTKHHGQTKQMSADWADALCDTLSHILGRRVNIHIFKNSCITHLLESGIDMKLVSKYVAHHEDISTTQIYDLRDFEEEKNRIFV
ncbi:tyrosine-type recombinase/integrase [Chengkuizengella marina]|uniref:Site-specific integrase n=1 Tax=Chengkuizengella marina TaxID=2507566 RepID=A0A6N9Q0X4_9BACL|nr:site-specific integrase [Chengkuizengella marina]NBI28595.1 site-specific integrase [Chengkuizengella marina]